MKFTVLGGTGFVGRHLAAHLRAGGIETDTPPRGAELRGKKLGHVVYAVGVVGGAKNKTHDMIDAHAVIPERLLRETEFDSFLYLSSTRVYDGLESAVTEDTPLRAAPGPASIFGISKILGESVCLAHPSPAVRVARLSNIYGADQNPLTFLGSVLRDLRAKGEVTFGESPQSSKDYLAVEDAARILQAIAAGGHERVYNVASGKIITHKTLAERMESLGHKAHFAPGGATRTFPPVDTGRIYREFKITSRVLTDDLARLIKEGTHEHA